MNTFKFNKVFDKTIASSTRGQEVIKMKYLIFTFGLSLFTQQRILLLEHCL